MQIFMWLDVLMIKGIGLMGDPEELMVWDEQAAAIRAELKKMNDNLSKIIDLKKQENYMIGAFFASMIFIELLFLVMNHGGN